MQLDKADHAIELIRLLLTRHSDSTALSLLALSHLLIEDLPIAWQISREFLTKRDKLVHAISGLILEKIKPEEARHMIFSWAMSDTMPYMFSSMFPDEYKSIFEQYKQGKLLYCWDQLDHIDQTTPLELLLAIEEIRQHPESEHDLEHLIDQGLNHLQHLSPCTKSILNLISQRTC